MRFARISRRPVAHVLTLVGLLFVSACGKDEPHRLSSADAFCEEWGKRACNTTVVANCSAPDEESCIDEQQRFCLTLVAERKYSEAGATECLQAVERAFADGALEGDEMAVVLELGPPCDRVQSGDTPSGGRCTKNSDCNIEEGFECVLRLTESGEPSGTCQIASYVGGGDRCKNDDVVCAEGFYCDGENCNRMSAEGEECSVVEPCAEELECVIEEGESEGSCEPRARVGRACEDDSDCQSRICAERSNGQWACATNILLEYSKPLCDNFRPPVSGGQSEPAPEPDDDTGSDAGRPSGHGADAGG
jgi:hypothetical protein